MDVGKNQSKKQWLSSVARKIGSSLDESKTANLDKRARSRDWAICPAKFKVPINFVELSIKAIFECFEVVKISFIAIEDIVLEEEQRAASALRDTFHAFIFRHCCSVGEFRLLLLCWKPDRVSIRVIQ